jgi:tetratricopeptide (TPR) repeat protein
MSRLLKGDLEGGLADAKEALRLDPDGAMTSFWMGNALLARGDAEGAIRAYGRTIERAPAYSDAWHGRAQASLTLGRLPEAIADATRAVELDSANVASLLVRAAARQRQRDFRGAEEDCTKAIAAQETGQAFLLRSSCRGMLGRFPEAAADSDKARGLFSPGSPQQDLARKWSEAFRAGRMP